MSKTDKQVLETNKQPENKQENIGAKPKHQRYHFKGGTKVSLATFASETDKYLEECQQNGQIPFLGRLALRLGISMDTVQEYNKKPEFAVYVKKVKDSGATMLFEALSNSKGVLANQIYLMKAVFGYSENQKLDITSQGKGLGVVLLPKR